MTTYKISSSKEGYVIQEEFEETPLYSKLSIEELSAVIIDLYKKEPEPRNSNPDKLWQSKKLEFLLMDNQMIKSSELKAIFNLCGHINGMYEELGREKERNKFLQSKINRAREDLS